MPADPLAARLTEEELLVAGMDKAFADSYESVRDAQHGKTLRAVAAWLRAREPDDPGNEDYLAGGYDALAKAADDLEKEAE